MSSAVESVGRLGPQSQDWRTPIAAGQEGKAAHSANQAATTNEQLSSKSWTQDDGAGRRHRQPAPQPAPQSASQRKVVADHAASTAQYEREAAAYAQFYAQPGRGGSAQRYNRNRVVQDHSASAAQYARDVAYYAQYQQLPTAHEQQQQPQMRGGRRGGNSRQILADHAASTALTLTPTLTLTLTPTLTLTLTLALTAA